LFSNRFTGLDIIRICVGLWMYEQFLKNVTP
jgi:hypothetical protein